MSSLFPDFSVHKQVVWDRQMCPVCQGQVTRTIKWENLGNSGQWELGTRLVFRLHVVDFKAVTFFISVPRLEARLLQQSIVAQNQAASQITSFYCLYMQGDIHVCRLTHHLHSVYW